MTGMIVAGVDGLRGGRDAVALGAALAAADDAELLLTGVWQETLLPLPALMSPQTRPIERTEQMLLRTRAAQAPRAITRPLSGLSPARALCRVAASEHAGTIAIGSPAAAPTGHARAGREAHHLLHDTPCSAALAARGLHERPFALGSIVVGVDGGAESEIALAVAARLASGLGVELTAVAVHDERASSHRRDGGERGAAGANGHGGAEAAEEALARAREHAGVSAAELRRGDPARELAQAAADADLLVLGSRHGGQAGRGARHGNGQTARVALGHVGHKLTTDAPCSLLLVPCVAQETG